MSVIEKIDEKVKNFKAKYGGQSLLDVLDVILLLDSEIKKEGGFGKLLVELMECASSKSDKTDESEYDKFVDSLDPRETYVFLKSYNSVIFGKKFGPMRVVKDIKELNNLSIDCMTCGYYENQEIGRKLICPGNWGENGFHFNLIKAGRYSEWRLFVRERMHDTLNEKKILKELK